MPNMHMSDTTVETLSLPIRCMTSGRRHDVAAAGCSWRKYLPRMICQAYTSIANLSKTCASICWRSHTCVLRLLRVKACRGLNAVHGGDPMINQGSSDSSRFQHSLLSRALRKSHVSPVRGSLIKSKLVPTSSPACPCSATARWTRGCEKSSTILALALPPLAPATIANLRSCSSGALWQVAPRLISAITSSTKSLSLDS